MSSHDAEFWLQIEPDLYGGDTPRVRRIKAVSITQKRPQQLRNTVSMKLTVRVPDAVFLPLRPEAVIVVPEEMVVSGPIEVDAVEPT